MFIFEWKELRDISDPQPEERHEPCQQADEQAWKGIRLQLSLQVLRDSAIADPGSRPARMWRSIQRSQRSHLCVSDPRKPGENVWFLVYATKS